MTMMGWRAFYLHTTQGTLVTELQPSSGEPLALIVIGGLVILRYVTKTGSRKLSADPVFWLACISWVLGFRASRFIEDWFWPAMMVWIACDLQLLLEARTRSWNSKRSLKIKSPPSKQSHSDWNQMEHGKRPGTLFTEHPGKRTGYSRSIFWRVPVFVSVPAPPRIQDDVNKHDETHRE